MYGNGKENSRLTKLDFFQFSSFRKAALKMEFYEL